MNIKQLLKYKKEDLLLPLFVLIGVLLIFNLVIFAEVDEMYNDFGDARNKLAGLEETPKPDPAQIARIDELELALQELQDSKTFKDADGEVLLVVDHKEQFRILNEVNRFLGKTFPEEIKAFVQGQ